MNILYILLIKSCMTFGTIALNTAGTVIPERSSAATGCYQWTAVTFQSKVALDAYLDDTSVDGAIVLDVAEGRFAEIEQQSRPRYTHKFKPIGAR